MTIEDAKLALDSVIRKSRVHFYKPIQVAEILHRNRVSGLSLGSLENYRSPSKRWRDEVSIVLVGNVSTSSAKFQDNLFEENAIPPRFISELGDYNAANNGVIENYIYSNMTSKMSDVQSIHQYLTEADSENFDLIELLNLFTDTAGLRRSMDKVYEIVAFALFDSVIDSLEVTVSLRIHSQDESLLEDFESFSSKVLGVNDGKHLTQPARVFRVGSTNANDGGLDLWANFGPAIQVKHFAINQDHLQTISNGIQADKFIVVCTDAEKSIIESVLRQAGTFQKVQSIITLSDLVDWYKKAFSKSNTAGLGSSLLSTLLREFELEFPSNTKMPEFMAQRGYEPSQLSNDWQLLS